MICFNYDADKFVAGEYKDEPDGKTTLRLTFSAGRVHPIFGKPQYSPYIQKPPSSDTEVKK